MSSTTYVLSMKQIKVVCGTTWHGMTHVCHETWSVDVCPYVYVLYMCVCRCAYVGYDETCASGACYKSYEQRYIFFIGGKDAICM